jgi:hypothetical protein
MKGFSPPFIPKFNTQLEKKKKKKKKRKKKKKSRG